jgi:hypothetical protein
MVAAETCNSRQSNAEDQLWANQIDACAAGSLALLYDMATDRGGSDGRKFTAREMQLIFERAGEADVAAEGERGYSLVEMQEIAVQVGLSPTDVARAASTISSPQASYPVLGGPFRFHASRSLESKLTDDGIAGVALKLREATGFHGELRDVPGGAEWRVRSATGLMVVDFTARGTGTRIDLTVARDDEAALTVIGVGFAGLVAGVAAAIAAAQGLHVGALAGVGIGAVTAIGGAWAGTRLWWSRAARRWARKTDALMESIGEAAERSTNDLA